MVQGLGLHSELPIQGVVGNPGLLPAQETGSIHATTKSSHAATKCSQTNKQIKTLKKPSSKKKSGV